MIYHTKKIILSMSDGLSAQTLCFFLCLLLYFTIAQRRDDLSEIYKKSQSELDYSEKYFRYL